MNTKRIFTGILTLAIFLTSTAFTPHNNFTPSKTCPIGYSQSWSTGKCVKIKVTSNKNLSKLYWKLFKVNK